MSAKLALSTWQRKETDDNYDHAEILQVLFGVSVVLTDFRRTPPSSQQRPRKQLSYSSSDSEADEKLSKELHLILAEPKEPVKRRIGKNKKKAEENRVTQMQKRQKDAEMITIITSELHKMSFMLHNISKWLPQFEHGYGRASYSVWVYSQCRNFLQAHGSVRTLFILIQLWLHVRITLNDKPVILADASMV